MVGCWLVSSWDCGPPEPLAPYIKLIITKSVSNNNSPRQSLIEKNIPVSNRSIMVVYGGGWLVFPWNLRSLDPPYNPDTISP